MLVEIFTFQCCENNLLCVLCIFSLCSRVKLLLFIISLTVHRKTNFLVNLYWDNKYSDSDSEDVSSLRIFQKKMLVLYQNVLYTHPLMIIRLLL